MDAKQLLELVIRPVLRDLNLWSLPAEQLVLGTACQESACGQYIHQIEGPALGIYQMEPATEKDIWINFLSYKSDLAQNVEAFMIPNWSDPRQQLIGNLYYATAMCRVHYLRAPEPIPDYLAGQAALWKLRYNTELGHGTMQQYMNSWNRFITPDVLTA